jgi:hypothetical protein
LKNKKQTVNINTSEIKPEIYINGKNILKDINVPKGSIVKITEENKKIDVSVNGENIINDENEKSGTFVTILSVIIVFLLVLLFFIILILQIAPDSSISFFIEDCINKIFSSASIEDIYLL